MQQQQADNLLQVRLSVKAQLKGDWLQHMAYSQELLLVK
jgi:hypothetical protein